MIFYQIVSNTNSVHYHTEILCSEKVSPAYSVPLFVD